MGREYELFGELGEMTGVTQRNCAAMFFLCGSSGKQLLERCVVSQVLIKLLPSIRAYLSQPLRHTPLFLLQSLQLLQSWFLLWHQMLL